MMYEAAWRRDCNVSRLPRVIIFSATRRAALARVSVVVMRPCSNRLVTRFRSVARRCQGLRPSLEPDLRCRIFRFPFFAEAEPSADAVMLKQFVSVRLTLRSFGHPYLLRSGRQL